MLNKNKIIILIAVLTGIVLVVIVSVYIFLFYKNRFVERPLTLPIDAKITVYQDGKAAELKPGVDKSYYAVYDSSVKVLRASNSMIKLIVTKEDIEALKGGTAVEISSNRPQSIKLAYNNQTITIIRLLVSIKGDEATCYVAYSLQDWSSGPYVARGPEVDVLKANLSKLTINTK